MTQPGHVFVVRGRLEHLDHDATLVPTDDRFVVTGGWRAPLGLPDETAQDRRAWDRAMDALEPPGWRERRWGRARDADHLPRPVWFVDSAAYDDPARSLGPMVDRVRDVLLDMARADLPAGSGRPRPLLALPTLGVGQGGFGDLRGEVIDRLLAVCEDVATATGVDIAVVAVAHADHAAFQARRRDVGPHHTVQLPPELVEHARALAEKARDGSLALFLGAGVSMSAGLPSWTELITRLAARADVDFGRLESALDRSELLRRRLGADLGTYVAEEVRGTGRYGLNHVLLAAFGVEQAVTTNYDDLYERAVKDHGDRVLAVLPFSPTVPRAPWLLKMHGDAHHPRTIVLARSDVVGFEARSRPMGAVVQSLLLTKHLLVVGSSMTDDNFLRLAHEVVAFKENGHDEAAAGESAALGTVLSLQADPAAEELWRGRFDYLSASDHGTGEDSGVLARRLAIFLDAVAMYATPPSHLADERYAVLLPEEERPVAEAARSLHALIDTLEDRDGEWKDIADSLRRIGAD